MVPLHGADSRSSAVGDLRPRYLADDTVLLRGRRARGQGLDHARAVRVIGPYHRRGIEDEDLQLHLIGSLLREAVPSRRQSPAATCLAVVELRLGATAIVMVSERHMPWHLQRRCSVDVLK